MLKCGALIRAPQRVKTELAGEAQNQALIRQRSGFDHRRAGENVRSKTSLIHLQANDAPRQPAAVPCCLANCP